MCVSFVFLFCFGWLEIVLRDASSSPVTRSRHPVPSSGPVIRFGIRSSHNHGPWLTVQLQYPRQEPPSQNPKPPPVSPCFRAGVAAAAAAVPKQAAAAGAPQGQASPSLKEVCRHRTGHRRGSGVCPPFFWCRIYISGPLPGVPRPAGNRPGHVLKTGCGFFFLLFSYFVVCYYISLTRCEVVQLRGE